MKQISTTQITSVAGGRIVSLAAEYHCRVSRNLGIVEDGLDFRLPRVGEETQNHGIAPNPSFASAAPKRQMGDKWATKSRHFAT